MNGIRVRMVLAALAAAMATGAQALDWETDYAKAAAKAKDTGKYLLLDFSGSDWCGWCVRLDKEVFSKGEFRKFADQNLVCVLVDFPRRKKQDKDLKEQNSGLAKKYGVRGFPTVILLSPDEALVGQTGYQEGGPKEYVKHLQAMIDGYEKDHPRAAPAAGAGSKPEKKSARKTSPSKAAKEQEP